mmetsp:Transcript_1340/g.2711  ORF Transcript_1340/g.2711 Transcript_1340/m.2711 type:complete len:202 (-) Transcript_1340:303-908(-)
MNPPCDEDAIDTRSVGACNIMVKRITNMSNLTSIQTQLPQASLKVGRMRLAEPLDAVALHLFRLVPAGNLARHMLKSAFVVENDQVWIGAYQRQVASGTLSQDLVHLGQVGIINEGSHRLDRCFTSILCSSAPDTTRSVCDYEIGLGRIECRLDVAALFQESERIGCICVAWRPGEPNEFFLLILHVTAVRLANDPGRFLS